MFSDIFFTLFHDFLGGVCLKVVVGGCDRKKGLTAPPKGGGGRLLFCWRLHVRYMTRSTKQNEYRNFDKNKMGPPDNRRTQRNYYTHRRAVPIKIHQSL